MIALYFDSVIGMAVFLGLILFEGITNLRVPKIITRMRFKLSFKDQLSQGDHFKIAFEAERLMRLSLFLILYLTYFQFNDVAWFFPWFLGAMLILAGISRVCPMVMMYRYLGFR